MVLKTTHDPLIYLRSSKTGSPISMGETLQDETFYRKKEETSIKGLKCSIRRNWHPIETVSGVVRLIRDVIKIIECDLWKAGLKSVLH